MTHSDSIWAEGLEQQIACIHENTDSLGIKYELLQNKLEFLSNVVETANDSVSNQLTCAGLLLALVAVIITIGGIFLGIYIDKKQQQINLIQNTVEEKKKTIESIAITTQDLDKKINNDIESLYKRLRHEETKAFLERLVQEPLDIANLSILLYARDMDEKSFKYIREAFLKLKALCEKDSDYLEYLDSFLLVLYQHYTYPSLKDDAIRSIFIKNFSKMLKCAYERDVIKSTIDLCRAISDENSTFNKEDVLVVYLKALNNSKYSSLVDLKNIFEQNITPDTLMPQVISRCKKDGISLSLFENHP